jgi:hypothetical protein
LAPRSTAKRGAGTTYALEVGDQQSCSSGRESRPRTDSEQQSPASQAAFPAAGPHFAPEPALLCSGPGLLAADATGPRARKATREANDFMVSVQEQRET